MDGAFLNTVIGGSGKMYFNIGSLCIMLDLIICYILMSQRLYFAIKHSLELFYQHIRGREAGCAFQAAAALKSTVRAQNTIKLNCAMNDSFFLFIFYRGLFLVP